jgi:hypothetical protein
MLEELNINNMETKQKVKPETLANVPDVSQELAEKVVEGQKNDAEVQQALVDEAQNLVQYKKTVESIKGEKGLEKEDKESSQRRQAYIQAGFKLIADALEAELGKNIFKRGFITKKGMQKCLDEVNFRREHLRKNEELDSVNWAVVINQAKFVSKKDILPQLEALKSVYLKPEDLSKLDPQKEKMENQIKSSTLGMSGGEVQF